MPNPEKPLHPLAEVFGFPTENQKKEAKRYRKNKLCPFNNKVPSCTKDKANDPLGVCSVYHNNNVVITCPVRFRENWLIVEDAARFFFGEGVSWTSLTEVKLTDKNGKAAGNIDIVLVQYNDRGKVLDFGSIEIQAVYITGNIRKPFEYFSKNVTNSNFDWQGKPNYPKPDFLSSSRKRLIPQMLYKGSILKAWEKKQAVVLQKCFFETLPELPLVDPDKAEVAWFLYDLEKSTEASKFDLVLRDTIFTQFTSAMERVTTPEPGDFDQFVEVLQEKLDEKLDGHPPDNRTLLDETLQ
ncbi:MAG: NotI family restriction endonuclease [bacterium]